MDEFLILLQAKLDEAKSKGNVNADIKVLQNQLDKLKIQVEIDPKLLSNIVKQLESALGQKIKIPNIAVDSKIGQQIGTNIGQNVADGINKSSEKVNAEVQKLANKVNKIQLSMDNGRGASEYQNRINAVTASLEKYGVGAEEAKKITASLQSTFNKMKNMSGQELVAQAEKLEKEFKSVKASVDQAKLSYDKFNQPVSNEKATSLINRINTFLTKNTRITKEARTQLEGYAQELSRGVNLNRWNEISNSLKKTENSMRGLGRLGASLRNQFSQAAGSFTQWLSVSSGIMFLVSQTRSAITEIKTLDNTLTEISKTSNMSGQQLKQLGMDAYDAASRYGRVANDYLTGVQEMNRSGFYGKKGTDMAEQSLLAQSAGDMDRELADRYILATNAAYKLNGEAEKINAVLDGQNSINKMVALYRNI